MSQRRSSQRRHRSESPTSEVELSASQGLNLNLANPHQTAKHLFLQSLISHRLLPHFQAKTVYKQACTLCNVESPIDFQTFIAELEPGLALLGLEIKVEVDQEGGGPVVAVVNTVSDSIAKIATELAPQQLVFFRLVVDKIMTAPRMAFAVSVKDATKSAKDKDINPSMSFTQAEDLLKALVYKGWLTLHPNRQLSLSTRSLIELGPYLRDKYLPDEDDELEPQERAYAECHQCLTLVTSGWACPNGACEVRLHRTCAAGALTGRGGKCPASLHDSSACSAQWAQTADRQWSGAPVGLSAIEAAADGTDGSEAGTATPAAHSSPVAMRPPASQTGTAAEVSAREGTNRGVMLVESSDASGDE